MIKNTKHNKGFSLVEALVSVSIVTLIMTTILFNYSTFNDRLALSSAGQELAVTIRQSQTYGLTVKEASVGGGRFDSAYGVYFDLNRPNDYYLFVDLDGNKKFTEGLGCGSGPSNTECIERFTFRNGIRVSSVCNATTCPPANTTGIHVTFLRPNPDADINLTNSSGVILSASILTGKVVLSSPKGKTLTITIESTGQVLVGEIL